MTLDQPTDSRNASDLVFTPVVDWQQLPDGLELSEVVSVDLDSRNQVYVFSRGSHPVFVFAADGSLLNTWGDGLFQRPHGLIVAPDDTIWCADDFGHAVYHFTSDGELLATLGTPGEASDTGCTDFDYRTIQQAAGPFNAPTNMAVAADGSLYVSDGYCNARIHHYSANLELLASWGDPGAGPGQFGVAHDVGIANDGTVFVCDRENSRLQLFAPDGTFQEEWTDVARPCNIAFDDANRIYVSELGYQIGMYVGNAFPDREPIPSRVTVFDRAGTPLARFGSGDYGQPGHFFAAHGIAVSAGGDLYVGEVRPGHYGAHANDAAPRAPMGTPVLQKFTPGK